MEYIKTCLVCGKTFLTKSIIGRRARVTCSHRCFIVYKKYQRDKDCLFFDAETDSWKKLSLKEYIIEELRLEHD